MQENEALGQYTAVIQHNAPWWIGWIKEVPGINGQGATRAELLEDLQVALEDMLELNREEAVAQANGPFEEVRLSA